MEEAVTIAINVVSTAELMEEAVTIAINYNISADDACYVALSQQTKTTLLTLDQKLVNRLANSSYNICLFKDFTIPPLPIA